jgi:hypothetical protein
MYGLWWVSENVEKVNIRKYTRVIQIMLKTSHEFRIDIPESQTDIPESHTPLALFIKIKYVFIK